MSTSTPPSPSKPPQLSRSHSRPNPPIRRPTGPTTPHHTSKFPPSPPTFFPSDPSLDIHLSPTKALAISKLTHELNTLQTWLETLFAPLEVPTHLLAWRGEARALASSATGVISTWSARGNANVSANVDVDGESSSTSRMRETETRSGSGNGSEGNEVLDALKALRQENLKADYLVSLVHGAEVEELEVLRGRQGRVEEQRREGLLARVLLDQVLSGLSGDGKEALENLSTAGVVLGVDFSCVGEEEDLTRIFMERLLKQVSRKVVLEDQILVMEGLNRDIARRADFDDARLSRLDIEDNDMHDEKADETRTQTAQFNRDTKQINLKIMEYEDRARGLERQLTSLRNQSANLQDLLEARRRIDDRKARIEELQQRLAAFHGLPPDLEASRSEVKRSMSELDSLKRKREELFGRLGSG